MSEDEPVQVFTFLAKITEECDALEGSETSLS